MPCAPDFSSLILSRPRPRGLIFAKLRGLAVAGTLYALALAALIVAPFFVLEVVDAPKAGIDPQIPVTFRPPHGRGDGHRAGSVQHGVRGAPRKTSAAAAPKTATPRPRPVEGLQPPPEPESAPARETTDGADGDGETPGDPLGTGTNPTGVLNGDCPDCTGTGIPGDPEEPYEEGTLGLTPPQLVAGSRALPKYPDLARRAGLQGTVVLLAVVEKDGTVGTIEVVKSPDQRWGFDLVAIAAVKQWRYQPALLNGAPVAAYIQVMVEFTLAR